VVALLAAGDCFGEGCLTGQVAHMSSAIAATDCRVLRIAKDQMLRVLQTEHVMSTRFIAHLLARNIRVGEDLIDQMFHSCEKRLARALLLLAHFDTPPDAGPDEPPRTVPPMSQETLADMIGTTRSRVNVLMKKFERLGLIDARDGLKVHRSL
jgi:CRP/FNR family transcriptional regulator, cyclic AMP receptor protein